MFNPADFIDATAGLNLPDDYDKGPLIELVKSAHEAGLDESADSSQEQIQALLKALRSIIKTTTDPVAKAAAIQAVALHEALE